MLLKAKYWIALGLAAGIFSAATALAQRQPIARPTPTPAPTTAPILPPAPQREFRGVWIATVDNIDWPSRKDLTPAQQQAELITLLDRAAKLRLNAVVFQVRPQCDALYPSQLEPWSEYLTGQMGRAPAPYYDPLAFAIAETHKRGMEFHAWFNPYRALHPSAKGPVSANHISKAKPQLVRKYGRYLWLDPGERDVMDHSLAVVLDVVKRYDVDGVHFDDYFYPYPDKDAHGQETPFPDDASWQKSGAQSKLSRDDWRRENANEFVRRVYQAVKAEKAWVKCGVSPFGIWRPGYPAQIKGFDQYDKLYADARKWLVNGWVDYFAPQLYWAIDPPAQSFPVLLKWWNEQNPQRRHIWPGVAISKMTEGWKPQEIVRQVRLTDQQPVSSGLIFYSMKHFARNPNLMSALAAGPYTEAALIPAMPWLPGATPPKPSVTVTGGASPEVSWTAGTGAPPHLWVVQLRTGQNWKTEILPATTRSLSLRAENLDAVAVSAVNRVGALSTPTVSQIGR